MDKIKYAIDEIINDILICENLDTNEKKDIPKKDLDFNVKEKDIIMYDNGKYYLLEKEKDKRLEEIKTQLERLKALKK